MHARHNIKIKPSQLRDNGDVFSIYSEPSNKGISTSNKWLHQCGNLPLTTATAINPWIVLYEEKPTGRPHWMGRIQQRLPG
jgi:hypothetical protein